MRRQRLVDDGAAVLVALSGGGDSVALLHLSRELESTGVLKVVGVAHFNHQLRGAAADEDEQFCRELARQVGVPIEVGTADVRSLAAEQGRSVEDAAREERYGFLRKAADRLNASLVAVAHTAEDQAETFLLRLLRGAGPRGLTGIHPRAGRIVRPLLEVHRAELRAYLDERNLAYREDATNDDVTIPRNRIRHELIPYLGREFSPGIVDVLAREAAIARADEDRLQAEAIDLASTVVLRGNSAPGFEIDTSVLTSMHPALASRVVRTALSELAGGRFIGYEHIDDALEFARSGKPGAELSLPGQQLIHRGSRVELRPKSRSRSARPATVQGAAKAEAGHRFRIPLSIPGEAVLSTQGWSITAAPVAACPDQPLRARGDTVAVAAEALALPLAVRTRRPGDRFKPLGLGGADKKLQDFLVDRKVPRETRDELPLVVDGTDRIVWVVGHSVGEDFRVTEPSRGVILLKARRLGGEG